MPPPIIPHLLPSPYPSIGLCEAHFDNKGGAYLQDNKRGNYNSAIYTVNSSYQIIIPTALGGSNITWVRGVWLATVQFRWDGFMADIKAGQLVDTTNFLSSVINQIGQTVITCTSAVGIGTQVQVYYSYRTGERTIRGQAVGGWPQLHLAANEAYGTANDGDCYIIDALYYLYQLTNDVKYKNIADRILVALLEWGGAQGQKLLFEIPLSAEESGSGIYDYYGSNATWNWEIISKPNASGKCLMITANLPGAPDYGYAGWGWWPEWPITIESPINGFKFEIYGDGTGKQIEVSTNIDPNGLPIGDVFFVFPMLAEDINKWRTFSITQSDLLKLSNIVFDGDRAPFGGSRWITYWVDGLGSTASLSIATLDNEGPNGIHRFYVQQFTWNRVSGGWVGFSFDADSSALSTGTATLKMTFYSSVATTYDITIKDANNILFIYILSASMGWQNISIPWTIFGAGIVHPIKEIKIDDIGAASGTLQFDDVSYDSLISMASSNPTQMKGLQFALKSYGSYTIYFDNIEIVQTAIDPYPAIPRWTYKWLYKDGYYGKGAWRGPSSSAYLWFAGIYLSGETYNDIPLYQTILQFHKDSQDAYKIQFPSTTKGLVVQKYGRWGWDSLKSGYVAGSQVASVLNKFYWSDTEDDWHGYQWRSALTIARHYYLTRDIIITKPILDNWMNWINTGGVQYNVTTGRCDFPTNINYNGTLTYEYSTSYGHICMAAVCIYKYWVDGDSIAYTWYRRFLDDLHNRIKITAAGYVEGINVSEEGSGYTSTPTIIFTGGGGSGAAATANLSGGKIITITVTANGTGYTSTPTISFSGGGGSGAVANAYLINDLYGAYDDNPTGWEHGEMGNTLAMLINGARPGGTISYPLSATANDIQDFIDLHDFYIRTARDFRPSMMTTSWIPFHEYTTSSWHIGKGIENPIYRDTHIDGDLWTESLGPTLSFATEWARYSGDWSWVNTLYSLIEELTGNQTTLGTPQLGIWGILINLNPNFDYLMIKHIDKKDIRTKQGNLYSYIKKGGHTQFKLPTSWVNDIDKSIINMWWRTKTNLKYIENKDKPNENFNVRIMNIKEPLEFNVNQYYKEYFEGEIILETI